MKVALFSAMRDRRSHQLAQEVVRFFAKRKIQLVSDDEGAALLGIPLLSRSDASAVQFIITMGGDGFILKIAHQYVDLDAAILGINLGHLGFMADVGVEQFLPGLEALINGHYTIQQRMMLEGRVNREDPFFSINDCVFHRAHHPNLVEVALYVNEKFLNTFEADGMIIATPNGSTAYSLAAGGPIVSPDLEAYIITPICPHTISNRPVVLPSDCHIRVQYVSQCRPIEVTADGLHRFFLKSGESVHLQKSQKTFNLIHLGNIDYFSTLRTKLNWSGKLKPKKSSCSTSSLSEK